MAYFECLHEVKLIVDLIYEGGIANMNYSISNTAEYGEYVSGPRVVTPETKAEMKRVLDDIQSGRFTRDWMLENKVNQTSFKATRAKLAEHPIEQVGAKLREMMPWIKQERAGRQEQELIICAPGASRSWARVPGLPGVTLLRRAPPALEAGLRRDEMSDSDSLSPQIARLDFERIIDAVLDRRSNPRPLAPMFAPEADWLMNGDQASWAYAGLRCSRKLASRLSRRLRRGIRAKILASARHLDRRRTGLREI